MAQQQDKKSSCHVVHILQHTSKEELSALITRKMTVMICRAESSQITEFSVKSQNR